MVAAEDASLVAGEIVEQAEFGGRGGNGLAAHGKDHGRRIDFNFPDLHGAGRKRTLEAAQNGFDSGHEFARAEGLGDIVVGAEFEAENAIGLAAFCGQENDRDRGKAGRLANRAADFESVFTGDHDVEDKERRTLAFGVGREQSCRWGKRGR